MWRIPFVALLLVGFSFHASAGPYTDKAARCLIVSTLKSERTDLALWIFLTLRDHPALEELPKPDETAVESANRKTAALVTELISSRCTEEFREARKHEGDEVWETSFSVLGQIAGREIFSHQKVQNNVQGFKEFLDLDKLNGALKD
ncbi:hypothetical protein [Nisaea sediminum]|uniref:hypothetical protein n=1 Tax=Nisaea sediminum TaxID=2775867 RepID=UPI0018681221|nr:hypothetical protein [Nisaea sediminum]